MNAVLFYFIPCHLRMRNCMPFPANDDFLALNGQELRTVVIVKVQAERPLPWN